jgi:SNF2 family DNA or RNA helicase
MEGLSEAMRLAGEWKATSAGEYIIDAHRDSAAPIVVFAHHGSVVEILMNRMHDAKLRARFITGATPMKARTEIVDDFQAGALDVLVGSIGAMGTGLTLTRARHAIMVEAPWSYAAAVQAEDRLHRIGQHMPVQIDYLCIDKSLDHAVVARMLDKQSTAHELLDRRRLELEALAAELI